MAYFWNPGLHEYLKISYLPENTINRQSCTRRRAGPQRPRRERRSREGRGRERSSPTPRVGLSFPHARFFWAKVESWAKTKERLVQGPLKSGPWTCSPRPAATGNGPHCTILHAILRSKCMRDVTEHVGRYLFSWAASYNVLPRVQKRYSWFYTFTRITCHYGLEKPINQTIPTSKNTPVVHFSAFVDLATEISAILPRWRLKLSVYFHLGEYYWKDFSNPAFYVWHDTTGCCWRWLHRKGIPKQSSSIAGP